MIDAPYWGDKPVILVGGGPSLRGFDFSSLARIDVRIVGVNQAGIDAPCHALVTADKRFVANRFDVLADLAKRIEVFIAQPRLEPEKLPPGANWLERRIGGGLSIRPDTVVTGGDSGYAAFNVAVLKRATMIYLLGFDYSISNGAHYHDVYPWFKAHNGWKMWALHYESTLSVLTELGIKVINLTPGSAIDCFRRGDIKELMRDAHPA